MITETLMWLYVENQVKEDERHYTKRVHREAFASLTAKLRN